MDLIFEALNFVLFSWTSHIATPILVCNKFVKLYSVSIISDNIIPTGLCYTISEQLQKTPYLSHFFCF